MMPPHTDAVIEVRGLYKKFGSFEALRGVDFTVFKGDVYGFLGPNGAGKSTSLRIILDLIRADRGTVRLFGMSYQEQRSEILSRVGCIIEKPDFHGYLSAQTNLELLARVSGAKGPKVDRKRIREMIDFVGLSGREHDRVKGFSHGMKQRLGIAQALMHDPDLILLDEPTTGLDPQGIIDIRMLILKLSREMGKTVVLSSHLLTEIELIATRMLIVHKGQSVREGSVRELLHEQPLHMYLDARPLAQAEAVLRQMPGVELLDQKEGRLIIQTPRDQVPHCSRALIEAGVQLHSFEPHRALEDYFLQLVNS